MSVYVVVHTTLKNAEKMQEYGAAVGPTVAAHGGKVVARGPSEVLFGENAYKAMVVIEFRDRETARRWYNSPEYQAIVPTRIQAMDSVFILGGE